MNKNNTSYSILFKFFKLILQPIILFINAIATAGAFFGIWFIGLFDKSDFNSDVKITNNTLKKRKNPFKQ